MDGDRMSDQRYRPCDYVAERTDENAQVCTCGAQAWDVCYDVFMCDACVAIADVEYDAWYAKQEAQSNR